MLIAKLMRNLNPERIRIYIDNCILNKVNLVPESRYNVEYTEGAMKLLPAADGMYKVSRKSKGGRLVPVIDKENQSITNIFSSCSSVMISFYEQDGQAWVQITGVKEKRPDGILNGLSFLSFCSGTGLSSHAFTQEGFRDIAFCEFNFKGDPDRYSDIYMKNNPDSIMLNMPMQYLRPEDLPKADVWLATLDCTQFSLARRNLISEEGMDLKPENAQSKGLFLELWRLAKEVGPAKRPKFILIENVAGFKTVAGEALKIGLEAMEYYNAEAMIDSAEFGSRTRRNRYLLAFSLKKPFEFPEAPGPKTEPINADGVITLDSLRWMRPEESDTLKFFLQRDELIKAGKGKNNFVVTTVDITKDTVFPTITKTHLKRRPEGIVKHPTEELYAWVDDVDSLKYLHEIEGYDLGDNRRTAVEAIGQGVSVGTFRHMARKIREFLEQNFSAVAGASIEIQKKVSAAPQQLTFLENPDYSVRAC